MSDRPVNVNIRLALDQAALQQSAAGVDDIQKTLDTFRATLNDTGSTADKVGPNVADALSTVKTSASDATDQVKALNSALESTSQTAAKVSSNSSGLTGLRRTGSALTQLGLGDIGQPIQKIGDLGQVTKELGVISEAAGVKLTATGVAFGGLEVATGPLIVAVGAIVAIVGVATALQSNYNAELKKQEDALTALIAAQEKYNTDLYTLTTAQAQKALEDAKNQRRIADENYGSAQDLINQKAKTLPIATGFLQSHDQEGQNAILRNYPEFKSLFDALDKASANMATDKDSIDLLTSGIKNNAFAANDAKIAEQKLQDTRDQNADKLVTQARQDAQLAATGSSNSVEAQIADIQAAKKAIESIDFSKLSDNEALKLTEQWNDLKRQEIDLTNNALPLIKAREAETKATQDQVKAADDIIKARKQQQDQEVASVNKYNNAVTAANDAAATAKLAADDKLNTAIQTADDNEAQALVTAHQKYNDALVTAAQNAVDVASKALEGLQQKQADNLTSYNRDQAKSQQDQQNQLLDDQIKAHRTEQADLQTHLDNLKQIRDRDSAREQNDLLNRNFLDLVSLRFGKTQDMNKENDRYAKQEEQLQTSLKNQEDDQARSFDQQRQSRAIAYQNANADALKQYHRELENAQDAKEKAIKLAQAAENKELQVAEDAHAKALQAAQNAHIKELNLIVQNTTAKLKLLYDGAVAELKLIDQTEAAKLKIYQNSLKQAQSMAGNTSVVYDASPSGVKTPGKYKPFAAGGMVGAGQRALVNDGGGTEGFNGVKFPPGLGLFIPTQSGYINSASGGGKNINMSITVNAAQDPIATAQFVKAHVADALHKVMGD